MKSLLRLEKRRGKSSVPAVLFKQDTFFPLFLLFIIGSLSGCIVGLYLSPGSTNMTGQFIFTDISRETVWEALWNSSQFFLLLWILSTSWLGMLLVPGAVILRGYLLSCSVSALFSTGSWRGLLYAFFVSGIPSLLLIPLFLIAAKDSFLSSRRLLALRFGLHYGPVRRMPPSRVLLIGAMILLSTVYLCNILPAFLARL